MVMLYIHKKRTIDTMRDKTQKQRCLFLP